MADLMPANIPLSLRLHTAEGEKNKRAEKIPGYKKNPKNQRSDFIAATVGQSGGWHKSRLHPNEQINKYMNK